MEYASQEYWNWRYHRLIPKAFRTSDFLHYRFSVLDPGWWPIPMASDKDPDAPVIDYTVRCAITLNGRYKPLLISKQKAPRLYHAILLLGEVFHSGNRIVRYMNLFKSYECISEDRRAEFSAIRHALSHPSELLTRRSTIEALEQLFGGRCIDLGNSRHQRVFFHQFGQLLVENDSRVNRAIRGNLPSWARPRE